MERKLLRSELVISADRDISHQKGAKHITTVINGDKVPAGVIIGKDTILKIKQRNYYTDDSIEIVDWEGGD